LSCLGVGTTAHTDVAQYAGRRGPSVASAWWLATFPGLAIIPTVLSINMIRDWLRDFLHSRLHIG
jgi:ABC-type dipeptide/oligopeptide/nickel transport system permease subunit